MTSLLVNTSALTALQSLRMTQQALQQTQTEVSTGLAINSAADNASSWSIAQTMQSDQNVYSTLSSNLSESNSLLNVAVASVNSAITVMNSIKAAIAQAEQPGADLNQIGTSLQQLGQQLSSIVNSSDFNGVNLLNGTQGATLNMTASYTDGYTLSTTQASTIGTISLTVQSLTDSTAPGGGTFTGGTPTGSGILQNAQSTGATAATDFTQISSADIQSGNVANTLANADEAISSLTSYASQLGATQARVQSQNNFIQSLNSALTTGVSSLVDADMNQVSTRLQALQTQQQLGIQSLSIANQNAQLILKLFQ